ncbi:MAG TPA: hypothetical protein VM870_09255 [Pyrinomonadaceae bacterium]|jgi:hypothetical protein|nr:hypothetical protein [Pyrinomonadaceae bacterium]
MGFWDSVAKIFEKQFVDRALNLSGQHKDLYCETCRRITDHVSISHSAALIQANRKSSRPVRLFSRVVGKISDLNPAENILIGRPYRCGSCGRKVID